MAKKAGKSKVICKFSLFPKFYPFENLAADFIKKNNLGKYENFFDLGNYQIIVWPDGDFAKIYMETAGDMLNPESILGSSNFRRFCSVTYRLEGFLNNNPVRLEARMTEKQDIDYKGNGYEDQPMSFKKNRTDNEPYWFVMKANKPSTKK